MKGEEISALNSVAHHKPNSPGWQILIEVAQTILSDDIDIDDWERFQCNLIARSYELIPKKHRAEVMNAVAAVGCMFGIVIWHD